MGDIPTRTTSRALESGERAFTELVGRRAPMTLPVDCPVCGGGTVVTASVVEEPVVWLSELSTVVGWVLECGDVVDGLTHELTLERGRRARFEARST